MQFMSESVALNIAIVGATGYSGREVVRWLQHHPSAVPVLLTGSAKSLPELKRFAGHLPSDVFFPFRYGENPVDQLLEALAERQVGVVFLATEAETSIGLA